jgi:hypothetical protein
MDVDEAIGAVANHLAENGSVIMIPKIINDVLKDNSAGGKPSLPSSDTEDTGYIPPPNPCIENPNAEECPPPPDDGTPSIDTDTGDGGGGGDGDAAK